MKEVQIFHLAVLRAAVEGVRLSEYFGATGALDHWISETKEIELIDDNCRPTKLGLAVSDKIGLTQQERCRAYLWWRSADLVSQANNFLRDCDIETPSSEPQRLNQ